MPGKSQIHVPIRPRGIRKSRRKWVPLKMMYYLNNESQAAVREISDEGAEGQRSGGENACHILTLICIYHIEKLDMAHLPQTS